MLLFHKKKCKKCNLDKLLSEFHVCKSCSGGYSTICKICTKEKSSLYYQKNKTKINLSRDGYYIKNRDKIRKRSKLSYTNNKQKKKKYAEENKLKISIRMQEYYEINKIELIKKQKGTNKIWKANNKGRVKANARDYMRDRRNSDPLFKVADTLRCRTNAAFKSKCWRKTSGNKKLLGADHKTVFEHIESKFTTGMNWSNHGEWHIDHETPLSSAKNEEELIKLFHYTNLQPLWKEDNFSKGCKLNWVKDK